jgi:hypothetical protein
LHQLGTTKSIGYNATIAAFFTEADILFSKKLLKVGLRASYNDLLEESAISHESLWHKVSKTVNFLWLWNFTQSPGVDYIKYSKVHQFESERLPIIFLIFNTARQSDI